MLEFISTSNHVVAFRISGKVTAEEFERIIGALDETIDQRGSAAIYVEILDIAGMTLKAFLKDIRYGFRQIGHLERFTRSAVVTDRKWLQTVADWEGKLFPGIEVRGFEQDASDEAMQWVAEPVQPPTPMLISINSSKPNILAYKLIGTITGHDVRRIDVELEEAYVHHETINLLLRIEKLSGFRPSIFGEHIVALKRKALKHVNRYAVVGGPDWLENVIEFLNPLFSTDIRHFDLDDEHEAWRWLEEVPALSTPAVAANVV